MPTARPSTTSSSDTPRHGGEFGDGRGAVQLLGELVAGLGEREPQLLEPARHPHRPGGVAEEALDLADDRRHRERRELHAAFAVEAVDRLDQADRADLDDVLHRLVAAAEAGRRVADEREVQLDEGVADVRALRAVLVERRRAAGTGSGTGCGCRWRRERRCTCGAGAANRGEAPSSCPVLRTCHPLEVADGRGGVPTAEGTQPPPEYRRQAAANAVPAECHMSATRCSAMSTYLLQAVRAVVHSFRLRLDPVCGSQPGEAPRQQPRHMHLGDAQFRADL